MIDTNQFNIRLSKSLLYDLEFVAQYNRLSRNDWLRVKLAELITAERQRILDEVTRRFTQGLISDDEFRQMTGISPTAHMLELREWWLKKEEQGRKSQEKFIMGIAEKVQKKDLGHFDRYFTGITKKVERQRKREAKKKK